MCRWIPSSPTLWMSPSLTMEKLSFLYSSYSASTSFTVTATQATAADGVSQRHAIGAAPVVAGEEGRERCSHEVWDASTAGSSCADDALLPNCLDDAQPIAPAARGRPGRAGERATARSGRDDALCLCDGRRPTRHEAMQPLPTVPEVVKRFGRAATARSRGDLETWCARRGSRRVFSRHATPRHATAY